MSRASLDQQSSTQWIRVGRSSVRPVLLLLAGLSVGIALFIAAPMTGFGPLLFGATVPWIVGYLVSIVVVAILLAPLLLPRASRPVYIDPSFTRVRVGLRARSIDDLRHAYRLPDGLADGRFQLRLALPGVDALIAMSARMPVDLSIAEVDALIALVERAPIEPDPQFTPRPPLGGELGERDAAQLFSDEFARNLLAHETMSFAKPVLLAELAQLRDEVAGTGSGVGTAAMRDIGVVAPFTTNAPDLQAVVAEAAAIAERGPKRGLFVALSSSFRTELVDAERALDVDRSLSALRAGGGVALIVAGFAAPWLGVIPFFLVVFAGIPTADGASIDLGALGGVIAFAILTWPFVVWSGIVLYWSSRVRRYDAVRAGALASRARGVDIPPRIEVFVGPRFADIAYLNHLLVFLVVQSILLLAGGLTMFAIAMGQVEKWEPSVLGAALGIVMVVASVPVFAMAVQLMARFGARQVRAVALWKAIASPLDEARE